ncbi:MAG TPA: hypothetical protein VIH99_11585 [Bdellovibrionota bacterium]|jgi:hypothetical protein
MHLPKLSILLALLAPAPAIAAATMDCAQQISSIDKNFQKVMKADPDSNCELNSSARHDKIQVQGGSFSVCKDAYKRMKESVTKYKEIAQAGCEKANAVASSCTEGTSPQEQKAYFQCMVKASTDAANAQKAAYNAMKEAGAAAKKYRGKIAEVEKAYIDDQQKIARAEAIQAEVDAANPLPSVPGISVMNVNDMAQSVDGRGILSAFQQEGDQVRASDGGASTISEYKGRTVSLVAEQENAGKLSDEFSTKAGQTAGQHRAKQTLFEQQAATNLARYNSTITAGTGSGGGTGLRSGTPAAQTSSPTASDTLPALTNLAQASAPVAGAWAGGGESPNPVSGGPTFYPGTSIAPIGTDGDGLVPVSGSSTGFVPGTNRIGKTPVDPGGTFRAPDPLDNVPKGDAPAGGKKVPVASLSDSGRTGDDLSLLAPKLNASSSASGRSSSSPETAKAGGGSSSAVGAKGNSGNKGQEPDCTSGSTDCGAMVDLKTTQFNEAGSLGLPTIGLSPELATAGALEKLLGPLSAEDPKAKSVMDDGMLGSFGSRVPASEAQAQAQNADAEIVPANTRSLFLRVHSVHEKAQKRGTVSYFHKKL